MKLTNPLIRKIKTLSHVAADTPRINTCKRTLDKQREKKRMLGFDIGEDKRTKHKSTRNMLNLKAKMPKIPRTLTVTSPVLVKLEFSSLLFLATC